MTHTHRNYQSRTKRIPFRKILVKYRKSSDFYNPIGNVKSTLKMLITSVPRVMFLSNSPAKNTSSVNLETGLQANEILVPQTERILNTSDL